MSLNTVITPKQILERKIMGHTDKCKLPTMSLKQIPHLFI